MGLDQVRKTLRDVEGYDTLVDDYTISSYAFNELASLLQTVVAIYLVNAVLMALVVLLNLDVMFVEECKHELLVPLGPPPSLCRSCSWRCVG